MSVVLIYPPATDPRAPQLALPSLAAYLRAAGEEVELLDLNISGLVGTLDPARLSAAAERLAASPNPDHHRLVELGQHAAAHAPEALATLRSQAFFDPHAYDFARGIVSAGLAVASAAAARPLSYGVTPIRYDVTGGDPRKIADLVAVTADPGANLFLELWQPLIERLATERPELVGITITNRQQILPGLMLARLLRARGLFVVLGGAVYSKFADRLAVRPEFFRRFADAVVVYEGETALLALLEQLRGGRDFSRVPNLLYLDGERVTRTPHHVENVDALPTPDFTGLDLFHYLAPSPVLPILTGKGCYFNRCKFCDIPYINHISNKAYRVRSVERIAGDVRALAKRFDARHFLITDEALSPKLLAALADELNSEPEGALAFTGYARLEPGFTQEVMYKLARMGMKKIFFGLESGSQKTLDHMDKGVNVADAGPVLTACRAAGVSFHLFSIIGFPEESEASARETYAFFEQNKAAIDHPSNSFDVHPFGLELRTAYFDDRESMGVEVSAGALAKDFVIGLDEHEWENRRGLRVSDVERLLPEFHAGLRRTFRRWHNVPLHLWPGFEEYAVLYSDHWGSRAFPFSSALPASGSGQRFRLAFSRAFARKDSEVGVQFLGLRNLFTLSHVAHQILSAPEARTAEQLFDQMLEGAEAEERSAREAQLRDRLESMIGLGLLQVALLPDPPRAALHPAQAASP